VTDHRPERPELPRIEVPSEVAAAAQMPDDLDANVFGPYAVPDTARRRRAGLVYVAAAVVTAIGIALDLPGGMWVIVAGFLAIAGYHLAAGWRLEVREGQALETANRETSFPVGHASAAVGFVGWRARPVWNVLVFSGDEPPTERGLVRVDGVDGAVAGQYVESIPPEDR
jgi:hypothetical protein